MKKIIISLAVMLLAIGVVAGGATTAFFADTETSTGNTFTAGAIDLKIDNESYYNGNKCALDVNDLNNNESTIDYTWQGNAAYPEPGTTCTTSWALDDLDNGRLFFNFDDLKPDDESEDTISIHVQNDAWACMDVSLTSNDDKSTTEPESEVDVVEDINNTWDGELAQNLHFFWWADDGDNVYEANEKPISDGVMSLMNLASTSGPFSVALADASHNVWGNVGQPLPAKETVYIAKAWCFGNLSLTPVATGTGQNPQVATGVTCDGTTLNNLTQTDGATVDVAFRAVQSRNNGRFLCNNEQPRLATLTVIKELIKDNGGNEVISDFQLKVVGAVVTDVTSGSSTTFAAGSYNVTEVGVSGYQATFSGDCNPAGQITLAPGDNKTCTITNNDIAPSITLIKNVVGGAALPVQFTMRIDGNVVPQNTSVPVTANSIHAISEDLFAGYTFTNITGGSCPLAVPGNVTLNEGQAITCTITNTATP